MSQSKQVSTKTLMSFCVNDFLKFSKHRRIDNMQPRDKTNNSSNCIYNNDINTKEELTLDGEKNTIIIKLNQRIAKLEARIQFLEAKVNMNKESITPTPKCKKFLAVSNSSQALQRQSGLKLFRESQNSNENPLPTVIPNKKFNKTKMELFLKLRSQSIEKDKSSTSKSPVASYYISTLNTNANSSNKKSIEQKRHLTIESSSVLTEDGVPSIRNRSIRNLSAVKREEGNKSTPCSVYNMESIPKIPRKVNPSLKSLGNASLIKEQLSNIKQRTKDILIIMDRRQCFVHLH